MKPGVGICVVSVKPLNVETSAKSSLLARRVLELMMLAGRSISGDASASLPILDDDQRSFGNRNQVGRDGPSRVV
jgi:hypothetical protein